ncbi:unnamed protein product [Caenorhabditis auriculariae]|uniref:RING-type domain-containing protein n=1 Tax=Caenorhabditis auriculariae TaxID=2777116 RepID=A0A8S1GRA1_9PELO|nr:unnamed protein product [Caenorhabditis auriculariae]
MCPISPSRSSNAVLELHNGSFIPLITILRTGFSLTIALGPPLGQPLLRHLSGMSNAEFSRCPTCLEDYDDVGHKPCIGFCGHSLCLKCQSRIVSCPLCKRKNSFFGTVFNYQLLDAVLAMKSMKNESRSPVGSRSKRPSEPYISQQVVNATRRSRRNALESAVDKGQQREVENNWLSQHIPSADPRTGRDRSVRRFTDRLVKNVTDTRRGSGINPVFENSPELAYQLHQPDNYRLFMLRSNAPGIHGFLTSPFTRLFFGRSCFEI